MTSLHGEHRTQPSLVQLTERAPLPSTGMTFPAAMRPYGPAPTARMVATQSYDIAAPNMPNLTPPPFQPPPPTTHPPHPQPVPSHYLASPPPIPARNLNSIAETRAPKLHFPPANEQQAPVQIFRCTYPLMTCLVIKSWLLHAFRQTDTPDLLRIETQDLHLLQPKTAGILIFQEGACLLNANPALPVTITALLLPHDDRVRWFYAVPPTSSLLSTLRDRLGVIELHQTLQPSTAKYNAVFQWLGASLQKVVEVPHPPDYLAAQKITDYCPPIRREESAMKRWESNSEIHDSLCLVEAGQEEPHRRRTHRADAAEERLVELDDDRYILMLPPVERRIAESVQLCCSKYLLVKRKFFQAVNEECKKKGIVAALAGDKKKTRGDLKWRGWLVEELGWTKERAKRLVVGWTVMGFFDERAWNGTLDEDEDEEDREAEIDGEHGRGNWGGNDGDGTDDHTSPGEGEIPSSGKRRRGVAFRVSEGDED